MRRTDDEERCFVETANFRRTCSVVDGSYDVEGFVVGRVLSWGLSVPLHRWSSGAYDLSIMPRTTAVCSSQCRGTGLGVPRYVSILRSTADRQRVNTVRVSITITAVAILTTIAGRPHEDRPETTTTLQHDR